MLPWCRNILWYLMHPNMLSTTLLTSTVQEPFPHFHSIGIAPRFHDVGIFYGTRCTPTCSVQPYSLPQCRNLFHTFMVQELFHVFMVQEYFMVLDAPQHAQYNPPHFHDVGHFPHFHDVGTSFSKYKSFQNISHRIQFDGNCLVLVFISKCQVSQNVKCFKISLSRFNSTVIVQS